MRELTKAELALSTKSTFRGALPAGPVTMEMLLAVLPYENEIVVCSMSGGQLQRVLAAAGESSFVDGPPSLQADRTYRVATTDYLANVAYKDVFQCDKEKTGIKVREEVRKKFR
jgi:2',3'-cyclic-nucleotide 2'-phosphodiesterase (5'-nucleotidase family)